MIVRVAGEERLIAAEDAGRYRDALGAMPPSGLPDAFLEGIDLAPPALDMSDLFSSMQRMMSSGEARVLNTITVLVTGTGLKAGEGELTLEAIPSSSELPGSAATIPIRVVNA